MTYTYIHKDRIGAFGGEMQFNCRKPIAAAMQGEDPMVWYETGEDNDRWSLRVVPTGNVVPEEYDYLDTLHDGPFVWHVYVQNVTQS